MDASATSVRSERPESLKYAGTSFVRAYQRLVSLALPAIRLGLDVCRVDLGFQF